MDWVRRAGDYRVLVGKRDGLGFPLGAEEQARLDELERFFMQDANRRRVPWASREQIRAPISVVVQLGAISGRARDISADGIFVETATPLPIGTRTVVCVTDDPLPADEDEAEVPYEEWRFGAEVVRLDKDGIGLRFVGIPLVLRITHRNRGPAAGTEPTPVGSEHAPDHAPEHHAA
jgi:PilZ domain